jgi:RimJ/RimL family protein N-acetyltransferase
MPDIFLRSVEEADLKSIYEWRNHPKTREMSFNSAHITWEEHLSFWKKRLAADNSTALSFIILAGKEPAGMARLDRREERWEVSILLAPDEWGKGIGTKALAVLIKEAKSRGIGKISARVKPGNPASKRIFEKNGFKEKYMYYELE